MRKTLLRGAAASAALMLFMGIAWAQTPGWFPSGFTLDTTAYTLRFPGFDRYQTAGIIALINSDATGEDDDYPFNWPRKDAESDTWTASDSCPEGIGISAGDVFVDALAASPVADLVLTETPVAGDDDTSDDMGDPSMLLTNSGREGATTLNPHTLATLSKLNDDCPNFDVTIFGREAAVPTEIEDDLNFLNGTGEVYRKGGVDRFETAKLISLNVFSALPPDGNPLPELDHFPDAESATFGATEATEPTVLDNVVFLAEAITGADALAIGPVASGMNVPIVLTFADSVPTFTEEAIALMDPDTIVVLGGTGAISDAAAAEAAAAAPGGADILRVGGVDRWDTSKLIAEQFFGDYADNQDGNEFHNLAIGFGRSEGAGTAHVGWPDLLAGAWLLDGYNDDSDTPERLAPEVNENEDYLYIGEGFWSYGPQGSDQSQNDIAAPMLLVQAAASPQTGPYVESLWDSTDVDICEATDTSDDKDDQVEAACNDSDFDDGNNDGGFGFVFGGTAAITAANESTLASHLSGGTYATDDVSPTMTAGDVFLTDLNWSDYLPSDEDGGGPTGYEPGPEVYFDGTKVCALRDAFTAAQWINVVDDEGASVGDTGVIDYQNSVDADDEFGPGPAEAWPPFESRFTCAEPTEDDLSPEPALTEATVWGVSISGHETTAKTFSLADEDTLTTDNTDGSDADGADGEGNTNGGVFADMDTNGETASTNYTDFEGTFATFIHKGTTFGSAAFTLDVLATTKEPSGGSDGGSTAGTDEERQFFTGSILVEVSAGGADILTATLEGECFKEVIDVDPGVGVDLDEVLRCSGMYSIGGVLGGIHFTIQNEDPGDTSTKDELFDLEMSGNA